MPGRCFASLIFGLVLGCLGAPNANGQETILAHQGKPLLLSGAPLRFTRDSEKTAQALRSFGNGKPILFNGKPNSDHWKAVKLDGSSIHWNGRVVEATGRLVEWDGTRITWDGESPIGDAASPVVLPDFAPLPTPRALELQVDVNGELRNDRRKPDEQRTELQNLLRATGEIPAASALKPIEREAGELRLAKIEFQQAYLTAWNDCVRQLAATETTQRQLISPIPVMPLTASRAGRLGWATGTRDFDQRCFNMELIFDESDIRQAAKTLVEAELPLIR